MGRYSQRVVHLRVLERSEVIKRFMTASPGRTSVRLDVIDVELFDHYVNYAYLGILATGENGHANSSESLRAEHVLLFRLYKLGRTLQDANFRNAVLDTIIDISFLKDENGKHQLPDISLYTANPDAHSGPRLCTIDLYVSLVDDLSTDTLPESFIRDVLKKTIQRCDVKSEHGHFRGQALRKCDYHEHPDGVRCGDGEVDEVP